MYIQQKVVLFSILVLSGCAITNFNPNNIIDITDEQWLENDKGERCIEREMLITPNEIRYSYPACGITRIVKPKPHILPKPFKTKCSGPTCPGF